jgi:hypothetical protein
VDFSLHGSGGYFSVFSYTPPLVVYQPIFQPVYVGVPVAFPAPVPFQPAAPPPRQVMVPERANGGAAGVVPVNPPADRPAPKPKDELEQKADMQRLIRAGNEAFAEGKYQQAARRYEQATDAAPQEPAAYFHLAQAHLALGSHAEAVLAIHRGLRLQPQWPLAAFQPRALYRDRVGDYQQHLARLADAVGKNLNDDSLLFLLGYQLWFEGRQDEATALFQRAATLALDTTFIDRFLKVGKAPGIPVAER